MCSLFSFPTWTTYKQAVFKGHKLFWFDAVTHSVYVSKQISFVFRPTGKVPEDSCPEIFSTSAEDGSRFNPLLAEIPVDIHNLSSELTLPDQVREIVRPK
jgi:hypothetical protein